MEKKDYRPMWKDLGLNLEGHDQLLAVLGKAYKDIYISQENQPKAMQYLDFVISEAHGFRIEELMEEKRKGNKVIGTFCVYVPEELVFAGGVAKNPCLKYLLEDALRHEVRVPEDPQMVGAYGAAMLARDHSTSC
jgi:ribulose kinase